MTLTMRNIMSKGIDQKFVHYGIRKDDLAMIANICDKEDIDFDWLSTVLRSRTVTTSWSLSTRER